MARQSAEAKLTVVAGNFGGRPDPEDLTPEQATIWRETCASEPGDFFSTAALRQMLADYCRHKATAAALSKQIDLYHADQAMDPETLRALDRLTKMRDRETKAFW